MNAPLNRADNDRISASFSACDSLLRSRAGLTPTLNRVARYRVNLVFCGSRALSPRTGLSSYRYRAFWYGALVEEHRQGNGRAAVGRFLSGQGRAPAHDVS